MSSKSLVTGGAGFIGSHVVDELLLMGHEVVAVDDLSGGCVDNVASEALFVEGSCTDAPLMDAIFQEHHFDYVFHLAAYAAEGLSHFIRRFNYENNVIGSMNVINASVNHGVKCLVFTSSIAVYGPGQLPMLESMTPVPVDPYGVAKYAVELDLAAARHMFGLDYIIFRPHNVYGERQNTGDRYRNVIGIFMNQMLNGEPCTIFGDGEQRRAFTHISDVASPIARAIEQRAEYGEVFNIGADTPYTVNELHRKIRSALGKDTGVVHLDARKEVVDAFADHRKAHEALGCSPQVSLDDGLARMASWVKEIGARESAPFQGIEVEKNMPPSWRALFD